MKFEGVTTSRARSGERRKDRNTSGQRGNKFNTSDRYISVVVAENNSVVKPFSLMYAPFKAARGLICFRNF